MRGHAILTQLYMALAFLVGSGHAFTFSLARTSRLQTRRHTMSAAVEAVTASRQAAQWHQNQFTISMPADSACSSRVVTTAVHTRLEPLLEGVGAGIAHLQVLNKTAYLSVGRADTSSNDLLTGSRSLSLAVTAGELQLGPNQDLLLHSPPPSELSGSASIAGGSVRFDFLCTWVGGEAAPPLMPDTDTAAGDGSTASATAAAAAESTQEQLAAELAEKTQGGHVVGQWRPMDEWSEEREAALVKALAGLGHDAEELRTSEEFFGSSALKVHTACKCLHYQIPNSAAAGNICCLVVQCSSSGT
jgi:hypothetical protein